MAGEEAIAALIAEQRETNRLLRELVAPRTEMLNQEETAAFLNTSVRTIQISRRDGVLVPSRLFPERVLFSRPYLAKVISAHDADVPAARHLRAATRRAS